MRGSRLAAPKLVMALVVVAGSASAGIGAAVAPAVGIGIVASVLILVMFQVGGPVGLVLSGLVLAWISRAGVLIGLPTTVLSYADLPLVGVAFVLTLLAAGGGRRTPWLTTGIAVFIVVGMTAVMIHDLNPVRVVLGVLLYLEPFLAVYVCLKVADERIRRRSLVVVGVVLVLQVPFAIGQWRVQGPGDPVQGTLVGAGSGAHLLGAGLLLGALMLWSSRYRTHPATLATVALALLLIVVADAKQVWAVIPIALAVVYVKTGRPDARRERPRLFGQRALAGVMILVLLALPLGALLARTYVGHIVELTSQSGGGKLAVAQALKADLGDSTSSTALGLGAGETVSRLGWILSPVGGYTTSPLRTLGIRESEGAQRYQAAAVSRGYVGESSLSSSLSSLMGVLGDYGLVGAAAYAAMFLSLVRRLWRCRDPMAAPALAMWVALLPLGLISDWLEQTPITLMVAVIAGLALGAEQESREAVDAARPAARGMVTL